MSIYPLDVNQFRATSNSELRPAESKRPPRHKGGEWFVKGPIPGEWLHRAAELPGHALHVGLAVWYLAGLEKCRQVKLTWRMFARFGTSPDSGRRGLAALERAGLVAVERHAGRCPVVTIRELTSGGNG
jgi:hypothetical protein